MRGHKLQFWLTEGMPKLQFVTAHSIQYQFQTRISMTPVECTRQWVEKFIIKLNICPFARRELRKNSIYFHESPAKKIVDGLADLLIEIRRLESRTDIETTLLIFPHMLHQFFDYLDFVDLAEQLIVQEGLEGIFQVASFHPDYCFADAEMDDVANYTNRSPFPMLHLLREASLEQAIDNYGDTSTIPENNIRRLRELGLDEVKKIMLS